MAVALAGGLCSTAFAGNDVAIHGSVQSDILFPEDDSAIGAKHYSEDVLTNTYANLSLLSKYIEAGARFEYLEHPLPGYDDIGFQGFKGWGVPNLFVKGKYKGVELTAGSFYEQFGSGLILRTYEDRTLGIDNSLLGGRLKINSLKGFRFTLLGGLQRHYWKWDRDSRIFGADAEMSIEDYSAYLRDKNVTWTVGASYVLKNEADEDIVVPGTNYRLNVPENVSAFDVRTNFHKDNFGVLGEVAWKSQDPCADNQYTYGKGHAEMLSATYSKSGLSAMVQAKRSENMAFRSDRTINPASTAVYLNHLPAFSYQHTYALAALYPYATQIATGEWAFQGAFAYNFKRNTPLGGKYGTKVKVNLSYIKGLDSKDNTDSYINGSAYGTDGASASYFGMGHTYYQDFNVQLEKKFTRDVQINFMYMYQRYNKTVVEGEGGMINSNILVAEGKFRFNNKWQLRSELQYLFTKQDERDWAYGLVELSYSPYLMFTLSDMWNTGDTGNHYYMASITGNYKANRLMLSYGRTRKGKDCSGGVCREVPATHGFKISYSYTF
jgi:hypothetical protein